MSAAEPLIVPMPAAAAVEFEKITE